MNVTRTRTPSLIEVPESKPRFGGLPMPFTRTLSTMAVATTAARIDAAAGRVADSRRRLAEAKAEAERLGLLPLALEARLAMAESGARPEARAEAAAIERDAHAAGLGMTANKARAINQSGSVTARPLAAAVDG